MSNDGSMITVGVDLAAESKGTAVAVIGWSSLGAQLTSLVLGATDDFIVGSAISADKIGIDCPFGWPDEFVTFVAAHARGTPLDRALGEGMGWRRQLAYRATDRAVREVTGRWPLSVSTDRLGLTAMRCAALLDSLAASGIPADRTGAGRVVEVYPAAALRCWGYSPEGYKSDSDKRSALIARLVAAAPWLDLVSNEGLMTSSDDALDAVLAALVARASALGAATVPPRALAEQATREGWIALPTIEFTQLTETRNAQRARG